MRVVLDPQLFQDSRVELDLLDVLLAIRDSPHQLMVHGDAPLQILSAWALSKSLGALPRLLQMAASEALRKPPTITLDVTHDKPESIDASGQGATVSLKRAARLIRMPLKVMLENGTNDALFLERVSPPDGRDWLENAQTRGWIAYGMGGGSAMGSELARLDKWERLRTWAMCDSDTWDPDLPSAAALKAVCAQHPPITLKVLGRRTAENYLPVSTLDRWSKKKTDAATRARRTGCVTHLRAMERHRGLRFNLRHHYHLANGFSADPARIPAEYASYRVHAVLQKGLGSKVKEIYSNHWAQYEDDAALAREASIREEFSEVVESIRRRL